MKDESTPPCLHQELGDYLEVLRCVKSIQGKCLTINEVCAQASMSTRTYKKIKRGTVRI